MFASLGLLCGLTLLVVASALRGMSVYQDAYGFTTLRLFVDVFEGWLGFVVLAIMVAGALGRGSWLPRIALVSGAVALIGLAAINPDAWVAERNIDRYEATGDLDLRYLQSLSADAAPVIVERLPEDVAGCVAAGADLQLPEAGDPRRRPGLEPGSLARRGRDRPDRPPRRRCGWRRVRRVGLRRMRWRVGRIRRVACVSWTRASDFCAPDLVRRAADVTGSGECPVDPMLIHF